MCVCRVVLRVRLYRLTKTTVPNRFRLGGLETGMKQAAYSCGKRAKYSRNDLFDS